MITSKSTEKALLDANNILTTLNEDTEVKDKISRFGYLDSHLALSTASRDQLDTVYGQLLDSRGEQLRLSEDVDKKFTSCYQRYTRYVEILKSVFDGRPDISRELGLDLRRNSNMSISTFISRATHLYESVSKKRHVLDEVTAAIGLTEEVFDLELTAVDDLETSHRLRRSKMGECQSLTFDRNLAERDLKMHIKRLVNLLGIALQDENPQLLERLCIFVRNAPKPKKSDAATTTEPPVTTEPPATTEPPVTTEPPATTEPPETIEPINTTPPAAEPASTDSPTAGSSVTTISTTVPSPLEIPIGSSSPTQPDSQSQTEKNRQKRRKKNRKHTVRS